MLILLCTRPWFYQLVNNLFFFFFTISRTKLVYFQDRAATVGFRWSSTELYYQDRHEDISRQNSLKVMITIFMLAKREVQLLVPPPPPPPPSQFRTKQYSLWMLQFPKWWLNSTESFISWISKPLNYQQWTFHVQYCNSSWEVKNKRWDIGAKMCFEENDSQSLNTLSETRKWKLIVAII